MRAITARQVHTAGRGRHRVAGAPGLYVEVRPSGARAWVVRLWNGTRETMRGLGSVCDRTLTEAKREALTLRAAVVNGTEPSKRTARAQRSRVHTWQDAFDRLRANKAGSVKASTLCANDSVWRKHIAPVLGSSEVASTTRENVINLIVGIEGTSAGKVRTLAREIGALAVSIGWAPANPAGKEIDTALPVTAKRQGDGQYRAMPHAMIAGFLRTLAPGAVANAIRMLALTGTRLGDVIGAEWSEIDGDVWTVPGARHKSGKDHPVPLTAPVLAILDSQRGQSERCVFPSMRKGAHLSDAKVRKQMHADYDLHGFRASLKTWSAEHGMDREATESVLAHVDGTAVERRYQRSDLMARRRALLDTWAAYVTA